MQGERDWLVKRVLPVLRERLRPYRIHLDDVDLRWGLPVTDYQEELQRRFEIVRLCLEQIDPEETLFLGILGGRYGTAADLESAAEEWLGWAKAFPGASITELEIRHGVLNAGKREGVAFLFRDEESSETVSEDVAWRFVESDPERQGQLAALKQAIVECVGPERVLDYRARWAPANATAAAAGDAGRFDSLEEFGDKVLKALWQCLVERFALKFDSRTAEEDQLSLQRRDPSLGCESGYHDSFIEERTRVYCGRESVLEELQRYIRCDDSRICVLAGRTGAGKSATLARLVADLKSLDSQSVIYHFVGASPESYSLRSMLARFVQEVESWPGIGSRAGETNDTPNLHAGFRELIRAAGEKERLVVIVDGVDQFSALDVLHLNRWLPSIHRYPENVRIIIGCLHSPNENDKAPAFEMLRRVDPLVIELPELDEADPCETERREMLREIPALASKVLNAAQTSALLSNPESRNPLYLKVALEELRVFGDHKELDARIQSFPQGAGALSELFRSVITRACHDFDSSVVSRLLLLLACSKYGLSENEILDLLVPEKEGERSRSEVFFVLHHLRPYLAFRGPYVGFYHGIFRSAVFDHFGEPNSNRKEQCHDELAAYFLQRVQEAEPVGWSLADTRALEVLAWHMTLTPNRNVFEGLLLNTRFLMVNIRARGVEELLEDFDFALRTQLESEGRSVAHLVRQGLALSIDALEYDPDAVLCQLMGRLGRLEVEGVDAFLKSGEDCQLTPWFRPVLSALTRPHPGTEDVLTGHRGSINALAVHPGTNCILSGGYDGIFRIWQADQGHPVSTHPAHQDRIWAVAASSASGTAASGGRDGFVRLWDVVTGDAIGEIAVMDGALTKLTCRPDGYREFEVAREKGRSSLRIVENLRGQVSEIFVPKDWGHSRGFHTIAAYADATQAVYKVFRSGWGVTDLMFSPDGTRLVTASWDCMIRLWNVASLELEKEVDVEFEIQFIRSAPGCDYFLAGLWYGHILAVRWEDLSVSSNLHPGGSLANQDVQMIGSPGQAICVHTNELLRMVDVLTEEWSFDLQLSRRGFVGAMGQLRNTTSIVEGGMLHSYEWAPSSPGLDFSGFIAVEPSQDAVWILRGGHQLSRVDLRRKEVIGETHLEGEYVRSAAAGTDCRSLAIGDCSGRIQILHLDRIASSFDSCPILEEAGDDTSRPATEEPGESTLPDPTGLAGVSGGIALTPNGEFSVSVHNDGHMRFWKPLDGELQWAEKGNWMHVIGVELNASGTRLVLRWGGYSPKERVRFYAIDWNGKSITELDLGEGDSSHGEAARIAFSGCGNQIAMITEYSEVVVRDTKQGGGRLVSFQGESIWKLLPMADGESFVVISELGLAQRYRFIDGAEIGGVVFFRPREELARIKAPEATSYGKFAFNVSEGRIAAIDLSAEFEPRNVPGSVSGELKGVSMERRICFSKVGDRTVVAWSMVTGDAVASYTVDTDLIQVVVSEDCGVISLWEESGSLHFAQFENQVSPVLKEVRSQLHEVRDTGVLNSFCDRAASGGAVEIAALGLLRLGKIDEALNLLRAELFLEDGITLRGSACPKRVFLFSVALFMSGSLTGAKKLLGEINVSDPALASHLQNFLKDWRKSLNWKQRWGLVDAGVPPCWEFLTGHLDLWFPEEDGVYD